MINTDKILSEIVSSYHYILKDNLVGVYLHGSLAMNCFNPNSSDIDLLIVVRESIEFKKMRNLINVLLKLSENGPKKGFEVSVLLEKDLINFKYPTPFLLHYSGQYKERYLNDGNYICGNSYDSDLAAHIVITKHRGICLFGKPIDHVFKDVPKKYYIESIKGDVISSKTDIINNPVYYVLNLCRVLYYLREEVICSKLEGGQWACLNVPEQYRDLIKIALMTYRDSSIIFSYETQKLIDFAEFMLGTFK